MTATKAKINERLTAAKDPRFEVHRVVYAFPRIAGMDRVSFKESVRSSGVIEPLVLWKDPQQRGKKVLVDGENRYRVWQELIIEGAWDGLPKAIAKLPTFVYEGDEEEMIAYVTKKNRDRRHLDSGQRACVEIEVNALWREAHSRANPDEAKHEANGEAPHETNGKATGYKPDGDLAERMARDAGTNRSYIFDAYKLQEESPALYNAVKAGELRLSAAKEISDDHPDLRTAVMEGGMTASEADDELRKRREMARKQADAESEERSHAAPELPPAPAPTSTPVARTEPAADEKVTDALGNEIEDKTLRKIFSVRADVKELVSQLRGMKKTAEALCESPGGEHIFRDEVESWFKHLIKELTSKQPHVVCSGCEGIGKEKEGSRAKCKSCNGTRFFDSIQVEAAAKAAESKE